MWQVSGRSDITDFEEVVRLDKEYITNWNIGLDMKILLKRSIKEQGFSNGTVSIGRHCWIGSNVCILKNADIKNLFLKMQSIMIVWLLLVLRHHL